MRDGVCVVHGRSVLVFTVSGLEQGAGFCPGSRTLNKDLPPPNKCPPQSVIDRLLPSLRFYPPLLLDLLSHSPSFPLFSL